MKTIKSGYIPESVVYCISQPTPFYSVEEPDFKKSRAFVSDSTNPATIRTSFLRSGKGTKTIRQNDPFDGLKIFGLMSGGNGASIWNCLNSEDVALEIYEDVLLEAIKTVGISPGGILNGQYVWGRVGSGNMKLVRVDSPLYFSLLSASKRKQTTAIKKKEIVPGHIYQQKNGEVFLYVGRSSWYNPENIKEHNNLHTNPDFLRWTQWAQITKNKDTWLEDSYLRKWRNLDQPPYPKRIEVKYTKKSADLWLKLIWDDIKPTEENLQILENGKETMLLTNFQDKKIRSNCSSCCHLPEDKKVVFDLGKFDMPNVYEQIRELAFVELNQHTKTIEQQIKGSGYNHHLSERIIKERNRLMDVAMYMIWGTLNPAGQEMDPSYDYWISEIISREPA